MIRIDWPVLLWFLLAGLLLAGCRTGASPTAPAPSAPPTATATALHDPLEGSRWELLSMKGQPPLPGTTITLNFLDGKISGNTSCNQYGAPYQLEGNRLKMVEMFTVTVQGCITPEGVMEQEQVYVDILTNILFDRAATYRIVPDGGVQRLEIGDALGVPLLIYQARPAFSMNSALLPGTSWRLVSLEGTPLHAAGLTFSFLNERELIGFAGCRHIYAIYQARGDRINMPSMAMIGQDCHENERLNLQESTLTDALSRASTNHLEGSRLDLLTEQGGVISFLAVEAEEMHPEDAVWKLAAFFGPSADPQMFHRLPVEPVPGSEITLEFDGQRASGTAGCNEYMAPYTMDASRLAFAQIVATDMHCAQPEGVMRQEADFLRRLAEMNAYRVLGGRLWLESDSGQSLLFIQNESER